MYNTLLVSVDELWLKGKNRPLYFRAVKEHLQKVLKFHHKERYRLYKDNQRFVISSDVNFSEETLKALAKVAGLNVIVPCKRIPLDEAGIYPTIMEELDSWETLPSTFKVFTQRSNKKFPKTSVEISGYMGHLILEDYPQLKVDIKKPELLVKVRILDNDIFISSKEYKGIGGLPVGMNGHLITLISGGFDSPVASFMMSKRGCRQSFIFFYAYPYVGDDVKEKILSLMKVLSTYQRGCELHVIPFGEVQNAIAETCKPEYRTLLFRKYMIECANLLATEVGADALLTGDSLGQVSSQTINNMAYLDSVTDRPIFRPLVGLNKAEIISISRERDLFDLSALPHDDACALFAPKFPIIKPHRRYLTEYAERNDLSPYVKKAFDEREIFFLNVDGIAEEK